MIEFGIKLKTLRTKHHFTQESLAEQLNVTKSMISAYENNLRMPSYDILIHIAQIFNVSTDYLLGLNNKNTVDLSGLTSNEIDAIRNLIDVMKKE